MKDKFEVLNQLKSQCINHGDGIYIHYHDHLSMDAWKVWIVVNGAIIDGDNDVIMYNDCTYYGTKGILSTVRDFKSKYPDLKSFVLDCSWYTFPMEYRYNQDVSKLCWDTDSEVLHIIN